MSTNRRRGRAWWEAHLNAIAGEGIGTKAYAQREGLPVSSLYYWRRRLKVQSMGTLSSHQPAPTPVVRRFVPVSLGSASGSDYSSLADRYVLTLGSGLRLELPGLPSPQWLVQVHQALAERVR